MKLKHVFSSALVVFCTLAVLVTGLYPLSAGAKTLSKEDIQTKALAIISGTFNFTDPGTIDGREVWNLQMKASDGYLHNMTFDAKTGQVVSHTKVDRMGREIDANEAFTGERTGPTHSPAGSESIIDKKPSLKKFGL